MRRTFPNKIIRRSNARIDLVGVTHLESAAPKFGLEMYWPLWNVFFAPDAISALPATWLASDA